MNPFGDMSTNHSTWPVLLSIYNLTPWLCMKKKYIMVAVLAAVIILAGVVSKYSSQGELERYETTFFDIFDTVTSITGYAKSEEIFAGQAELLQKRMQHYHEMFDIYHTYEGVNNIKTINDTIIHYTFFN